MSDDGQLLVTGGYDLRVVLWDLENMTHKVVLRGHSDWITDVCLTTDNKWIVSVSNDCDIRLWHIENCDNIKQVMDNTKTAKMAQCTRCGKQFSTNKMKRDDNDTSSTGALLCVFCRLEERQKLTNATTYSLSDYDQPAVTDHERSALNEPTPKK
ncbi:unnamed protein product [Adineta steineri]|uniref:Uncharacterized protein n=1 Tax=Adineta steineri TaxID=433720 RepID=A0A814Y4K8_9BILA|nr:unnamed protein product [Adineta steineri]